MPLCAGENSGKSVTGPSQGGRVWSRDPQPALFKILQNEEHYH